MAKQPKKQTAVKKTVSMDTAPIIQNEQPKPLIVRYLPQLIIALFISLIYSNSLFNGYAIDDTMVLTENTFTKKGVAGLKDIFTTDAFVGLFGVRGSQLVSGGRYRPLSIATLAVEYEISRKIKGDPRAEINDKNLVLGEDDKYLSPMTSHAINVALFIFCCLILFQVLQLIFPSTSLFYVSLPFIATLLFAGHPIHTEAVTNIKGRDEIMGLLFSLMALYYSLRYVLTEKNTYLILIFTTFFLGLLSKENTITFVAIIPMTVWFFTKTEIKKYAAPMLAIIVPTAIYLMIRKAYTAAGITAESPEILNNPFAYTDGSFELRYATIISTFILYFKLLFVPHPLTHDYYYNQIPYVQFSDISFILSLLANVLLVSWAVAGLRKKTIPSYAILFYYITFSVVSNLFFTVGVLLNERFMFFSSVGFCILVAYYLITFAKKQKLSNSLLMCILVLILSLYSVKTFTRNFDWKDNFTLFMTDVKTSTESAKIHTSCGGDLAKNAEKEPDSLKRKAMMAESIEHLKKAIQIYPKHSNAWLLLGNSLYKVNKNPQEALAAYEKALAYKPGGYYDALYNIGCVQVENGMAEQAIANFKAALVVKPDVFECKYNLAEAYSKANKLDSSIFWYLKAAEQRPSDAMIYYKIGTIYGKQLGDLNNAVIYLEKAVAANPKAEVYYEDLSVAYGLSNRVEDAIRVSLNCLKVNPNYAPILKNLVVSYTLKGDKASADLYLQQLQRVEQLGIK